MGPFWLGFALLAAVLGPFLAFTQTVPDPARELELLHDMVDNLTAKMDRVTQKSVFWQHKIEGSCPEYLENPKKFSCLGIDGNCFCVSKYPTTWTVGRSICRKYQMQLVSLNDPDVRIKLAKKLNAEMPHYGFLTSGRYDDATENWHWASGEVADSINWREGEPNALNHDNETERCLEWLPIGQNFNDITCLQLTRYFICQTELV